MTTAAEAATHVDLSAGRFRDLVSQGVIDRAASGQYDLALVRVQYIRYLRSAATDRGSGSGLAVERAALAREQREGITLKNAISRGEFAPVAMMERVMIEVHGVFRERILTIVGKLSDALSMRTREEIEPILRDELNETLDELSDPATLLRRGIVGGGRAGVSRPAGTAEAQSH